VRSPRGLSRIWRLDTNRPLGDRDGQSARADHYAEFEAGPLTLSVVVAENFPFGYHPNVNPIALHVEDMQAAREQLTAQGIEFQGDTFDTGVCHMSFFSDPDGNALMLHHRYAPRATEG
jgi:predicted enzyme related to lactoylglutathione lyase